MSKRKNHSPELKFKVAITAIKGEKTVAQISQQYNVAPSMVHKWKKQLLDTGTNLYANAPVASQNHGAHEQEKSELYAKIGQLTIERDFLKKSLES